MNEEKNYKERVIEMYTKRELPVLKRNEKFISPVCNAVNAAGTEMIFC